MRSNIIILGLFAICGLAGCDAEPENLPEEEFVTVTSEPSEVSLTTTEMERDEQDPLVREVVDALEVTPDGTLRVTDEEALTALLGTDWDIAADELERINQRIQDGERAPFTTDKLRGAKVVGAAAGDYQMFSPAAGYGWEGCEDKCTAFGMCCCDKWWIFCFEQCFCKP